MLKIKAVIILLCGLIITGLNAEVIELLDSNYKEKMKEHKKVVLMFSAPWCGACKSMKPTYKAFEAKNETKTAFTIINTDENEKVTNLYEIESLPTFVVLENGKEVKRTVGSLNINELNLFLNTEEVLKGYTEKCNTGDGQVCLEIGELYEEGELIKQDYVKAFSFYDKSCTLKNAEGCMCLGYMYDEALGVKKDYKIAAKYYEEACSGDNMVACRFLGYFYDEGLGVKKDYKKAHPLYLKACKGKDEYACNNLAYMYSEGNGVNKSLEQALKFYKLSCAYGYDDACEDVKKLEK